MFTSKASGRLPAQGCEPRSRVPGVHRQVAKLCISVSIWKEPAPMGQAILGRGEALSPSHWNHSRTPRRQSLRSPLGMGYGGSLVGAEVAALSSLPFPPRSQVRSSSLGLRLSGTSSCGVPGPRGGQGSSALLPGWGCVGGWRAPAVTARAAALFYGVFHF